MPNRSGGLRLALAYNAVLLAEAREIARELSQGGRVEVDADLGCVRDQSSGRYTISPLIEKGKARVARLRGYGNAIVAEVAVAWIESYLDKDGFGS